MKSRIWVESDGTISNVSPYTEVTVSKGIYSVVADMMGTLHLRRKAESFHLPNKIYGVESSFINRIINSYNASPKNMGVLLNGLKGSGKTFTAKIICNAINLPIVVIDEPRKGLANFLSLIDFNCVIFIDEYEKVFGEDERGALLSIMDGTQTSNNKLLFILTTNHMRINENLINRPSRIRYIKNYSELSKGIISEILEDRLNNKNLHSESLDVISSLDNITIDSLIELINEINVHDEPPANFIKIFNVNQQKSVYDYMISDAETGEFLFEFSCTSFFCTSTPTRSKISHRDYYDANTEVGWIEFVKHIKYDYAVIRYVNPERRRLSKQIDVLSDKIFDLEEDKRDTSQQQKELDALTEQVSDTPEICERSVKYVQKITKNWQYSS